MKKFLTPSILSIFITMALIAHLINNAHYWRDKDRVIMWDVISYYSYLPATFIYEDVTLSFMDNYKGQHEFVFWPNALPNGKKVIVTSMGNSIMYAPFFFIAHAYALNSKYDAGGYSEPYRLAIIISSAFFLILGLIFVRKILLKYFSEWITVIALMTILFGTNLLYYSAYYVGLTHVYSFALIAILLYSTIKFYENPKLKRAILIGLLIGLITLIRPTNIVVVLIFLFWGIINLKQLKARFVFFLNKWHWSLLMIFAAILIWLPQMLYWKHLTGHYLFNSYIEKSAFYFNDPRILQGVFSFRNGWLIYSPVMLFSLLGIYFLKNHVKEFISPIILFLIINLYVIFSWWCWWYVGFGMRTLIDSYALLAIPMAAFITWVSTLKKFRKIIFSTMFSLLFMLGVFNMFKYHKGSIHWDSMTAKAYFKGFFELRMNDDIAKYLDTPIYLENPEYENWRNGMSVKTK